MAQRTRLLVLYTGGTLGMRPTERGWEPGADLAGWLAQLLAAHLPGVDWQLRTLQPLIDSSNARPRDWQAIVDAVKSQLTHHDAFVVLHGTDTMAFTAAALHYALGSLGRAVVITGAQRSLVTHDSDAPGNVLGAMRCALDERINGVGLFFDGDLFAPDAVTKISSVDDHGFDSPNQVRLAAVENDEVAAVRESCTVAGPLDHGLPYREADVVVLTLTPSLQACRVSAMLTPPPQAVVVRAYGAGNAPDDDCELLDALGAAHRAGSVIVVVSQCPHGGVALGHYAVSQALLQVGAISGGLAQTDALVVLLSWLFSQGLSPDEVRRQLRCVSG